MKTYKWHSDGFHNDDEWGEVEAENMREAAKKVCEGLHELDHKIFEIDIIVATSDQASKKRYVVSKDYCVHFHATELPLQ